MIRSVNKYLEVIMQASYEAGEAILEIYKDEHLQIEIKGDNSPLTRADNAAHSIISGFLEKTPFPVLSEEGKDIRFDERDKWDFFWMVDPLDGTKEFINKNGEFTVNIALIHKTESILGVVYCPVSNKLYWGGKGKGSFLVQKDGASVVLRTKKRDPKRVGIRVLGSRNHMDEQTAKFIKELNQPQFLSMGSSLKFMAIAESEADIYPRFAPTMEWDTAAAQIILEEAGGSVLCVDTSSKLTYNKPILVNPFFIAKA